MGIHWPFFVSLYKSLYERILSPVDRMKSKKSGFKKAWHIFIQCSIDLRDDHIGAYSAMSAFFFILSLIPCIILLLTLLQFTPVSQESFIKTVSLAFPETISPLITSVVKEVYRSSGAVIPLTVLVALWSAGKGVMALSMGLNCEHDIVETRNYFYLRIRAALYTLFFLTSIVLMLVLQVFGDSLVEFLAGKAPLIAPVLRRIMRIHNWIAIPLIILILLVIYKYLPNKKVRLWGELPGALFCTIAWIVLSFIFSTYLRVFTGFSSMYGSLTTIILIMMWMYFLMMMLLIGGEINLWLREYGTLERLPLIGGRIAKREEKYIEKVRRHHIEVMRANEEKRKKMEL